MTRAPSADAASPSPALTVARAALGDAPAWLVGGALRDRLLGRSTEDLDVVVDGDARRAARAIARAGGGTAFALSEAWGAWRVVGPGRSWQVDLVPLAGQDLHADLALRDFTINALAEPLAGGALVDPHGGAADLAARRLRLVSPQALAGDPLRILRLARLACELDLEVDPATLASARQHAPALRAVAPERVFAELKRIVAAPGVLRGLALMEDSGATAIVLPELLALRGVEQNVFHHLDVHDHTLAVLAATVELERDPSVLSLEHADGVRALLAEPLADDLPRSAALRLGALLHDIAKPQTRGRRPDGRVTFLGHDEVGADAARDILRRLRASEKLGEHVAALTRHHLRLGFLVHERPLGRRAVWRYLTACGAVAADVTLLSAADRLATRGRGAEAAIAAHLRVARAVLGPALDRHRHGVPPPLVRGHDGARAVERRPGPWLGPLLAEIEEARFAGELSTPEEALAWARERAGG